MDQEERDALKEFFCGQKKLAQLGIIRSKNYIDDIAKHLCQVMYSLKPAGGEAGYDGLLGTSKIKVGINNCPKATPVRLEEPIEFDELIVVLGPNSWLRPENIQDEFIFYKFSREEVLKKFKASRGKYIGGKDLFFQGYDKVLSL